METWEVIKMLEENPEVTLGRDDDNNITIKREGDMLIVKRKKCNAMQRPSISVKLFNCSWTPIKE